MRRAFLPLLFVLIGARLVTSVWSTAGIGWDFANYHLTARRITTGDTKNLYRMPRATMERFYAFIGEPDRLPPGEGPGDQEVPSGRMGFIGTPISAYVFAPIGYLSPRWALLAFKLQSAVFLVASLVLLFPVFRSASAGRLDGRSALTVYLLLALLFAPFWFVFSTGGQATPLNLFLLVLFHRFYLLGRQLPAAVTLAAGILIKPFFLLMLPVLLLAGEWRLLLRLGGCLLLAGAVSLLLLGWPVHQEWIAVMREAGGGLAEPWWNNSSAFVVVYSLWCIWHHGTLVPGGEVGGAMALGIGVLKLALLALFLLAAWKAARSGVSGEVRRNAVVMLAILFALSFSSIVWPHYLSFLFLPFLLVMFPPTRLPRAAELLVWAALVSTLAVQSRFAQRAVLPLLDGLPWLQGVVAGVFGGGTILLALALFFLYGERILQSLSADPAAQPGSLNPPGPHGGGSHVEAFGI